MKKKELKQRIKELEEQNDKLFSKCSENNLKSRIMQNNDDFNIVNNFLKDLLKTEPTEEPTTTTVMFTLKDGIIPNKKGK